MEGEEKAHTLATTTTHGGEEKREGEEEEEWNDQKPDVLGKATDLSGSDVQTARFTRLAEIDRQLREPAMAEIHAYNSAKRARRRALLITMQKQLAAAIAAENGHRLHYLPRRTTTTPTHIHVCIHPGRLTLLVGNPAINTSHAGR